MNWPDFLLRLRALVYRNRVERDLEEELTFHLDMQARKNVHAGMSQAEAANQARIEFGGVTQVSEQCRDARGIGLLETVFQDIRFALRGFRRSPVFVLTVVGTIALGLGLDTALFTVFNATYLRPIGVREPGALYEAYWINRVGGSSGFSHSEYREFVASNPAFSEAFAYMDVEGRMNGRAMLGDLVSGEYFRVLGIGAALGRTLAPEDCSAPGRQPVVVLSYRAWRNQFLSDPDIVGRKVLLRGYPFTVVGVASPGFTGLGSRPAEFWAPVTMSARFDAVQNRPDTAEPRSLSIVGRLRTEFSTRQAQSALTSWMQLRTAANPDSAKAMQALLISRAARKPLRLANVLAFSSILAAFSLVLLIGCANVANMLLARSLARQREIAIRLSLGATRRRVVRQVLTESLLLALPAAAAGFAVSEAAVRLSLRVLIATIPPGVAGLVATLPPMHSDLRVFAFTLAVALASAIVFGMAPAIHTTRVDFMQAAKGDYTHGGRPSRLRGTLVAGQVTVCVLLLVTAAILLRGADRIHRLDATLSTRNTIQIVAREKSHEAVVGRLAAEPSVEMLAAAAHAPVERKSMIPVRSADGSELIRMAANQVSPEYFALFEIPLLRGRAFTAAEGLSAAPVAIVSQAAAQRLWPNREALGRSLRLAPDPGNDASLAPRQVTVVGIARDEISRWIGSGEDTSLVYLPTHPRAAGAELFVSVPGDPETARRKIDAALATVDPDAVQQIQKLQVREWVDEDAYFSFRVAFWTSSAIGVLALVLTLSGIYGVISYLVSQRTKEIGIRMALGASTRAVTNLVLRQSMKLAGIGALSGAALAAGLSKLLASILVVIDTFDVAAYIGGVAIVLAACAAAAWLPSRRASRIDPLTTLRYD
jgi:predicted permease